MNPSNPKPAEQQPEDKTDFQIAWELSGTRDKPFFIDTFKKLLAKYDSKEVSLSKMVEELNIAAYKWRASQPASPPTPEGKPDELTIEDYKEVFEDHKRLVREIDVIMNGENAAKQASLCDLVSQIRSIFGKPGEVVEAAKEAERRYPIPVRDRKIYYTAQEYDEDANLKRSEQRAFIAGTQWSKKK